MVGSILSKIGSVCVSTVVTFVGKAHFVLFSLISSTVSSAPLPMKNSSPSSLDSTIFITCETVCSSLSGGACLISAALSVDAGSS